MRSCETCEHNGTAYKWCDVCRSMAILDWWKPAKFVCRTCEGIGWEQVLCGSCDGSGYVDHKRCGDCGGAGGRMRKCLKCEGTGKVMK